MYRTKTMITNTSGPSIPTYDLGENEEFWLTPITNQGEKFPVDVEVDIERNMNYYFDDDDDEE
eukprot:CAMPEP_0114581682 /NCGR_PEP_ID=MMETSP0125-20121206/5765_1 /TAXON_ID=485358 ORGANISM="Aristerostoma sp., Strain ATCC 50986" /NCGR_SAMPLE_ID=MMETSP0125 /ASSEMBLY_ACC=CAM_ASM_000245 /LENGTH=62 /DNA_ID=CAMNT_0001774083 /DNA_START=251 /DNA_END=439 /DNA_ORIENTATION=-